MSLMEMVRRERTIKGNIFLLFLPVDTDRCPGVDLSLAVAGDAVVNSAEMCTS